MQVPISNAINMCHKKKERVPGISSFHATQFAVASSHAFLLTKSSVTKPLQAFLAYTPAWKGLYLPLPAVWLTLLGLQALGSPGTAVCWVLPRG